MPNEETKEVAPDKRPDVTVVFEIEVTATHDGLTAEEARWKWENPTLVQAVSEAVERAGLGKVRKIKVKEE